MNAISVLSQETIDKIAAGEVVERPSSVVKELVENAIDAGANAVTVEIRDGGIALIRITDNGSGIEPEEIAAAFMRHATSKIRTMEDLQTTETLGFRGEALSSVAAVSQVELITKTADRLTGVRYLISGGEEKGMEEVGAPTGSTFLVRNLFYNTPVRKKFLKAAVTEAGYIGDLMERLALSHPQISFKFMNQGQIRMHTSGNGRLKDIVYGIYGRDVSSNILPVEEDCGYFRIGGFIGKPAVSRGNRNYENYFVNGRYVRSSVISKAIEDAYRPFLMSHRYPFTVLSIRINGEYLDVNVHPTKMEVRFSDPMGVYGQVSRVVREALESRELIPEISLAQHRQRSDDRETAEVSGNPAAVQESGREKPGVLPDSKDPGSPSAGQEKPGVLPGPEVSGNSAVVQESGREKPDVLPDPKVPGSPAAVQESGREKPGVLPEPAADPGAGIPEKEAKKTAGYPEPFEQVRRSMLAEERAGGYGVREGQDKTEQSPPDDARQEDEAGQAAVQMEMFEDRLLSCENVKEHRLIGQVFDTYWLVEFRGKLYIIDQHAAHEKVLYERYVKQLADKQQTSQLLCPPLILSLSMQEEQLLEKYMDHFLAAGFDIEPFGGREYSVRAVPGDLYGLADRDVFLEMLDGLGDIPEKAGEQIVNDKLALMACKAAVKGNSRLSMQEADALIGELLGLDNPYNCPHGRPTIISMTKYELGRKFKRTV